jgi:hypothetical protein
MSLDKNQQVGSDRRWLNGSSVTILVGALFAVRWLVKRAVGPVPESLKTFLPLPPTWLLVAQVVFSAGGLSWFFLTRKNPKLRASALVILALALATIGGLLTYSLEKP